MSGLESRLNRLLKSGSYLTPFSDQFDTNWNVSKKQTIGSQGEGAIEFTSGHEYFGLHSKEENGFS